MPNGLDALSDEDSRDFENRLASFGLNASSILRDELVVPQFSEITLRMGPDSFVQPIILRTRDVDQLKQWIGIPNEVFERLGRLPRIPIPVDLPSMVRDRDSSTEDDVGTASLGGQPRYTGRYRLEKSALDSTDVHTIGLATHAYLRSDSNTVKAFRPIINDYYGQFEVPIFPFFKVRVPNGTVLDFGPGINVLLAYELEIEGSGLVRSRGHLTVSCTIVRKT